MSLILPAWVEHHTDSDDKKKRQTIFSIHTHPDGTRIATGGIDQKIRIWATDPILYKEVESDEKVHKLLCTLSRHTGSVLVVRWSPSGRFLASGSDDTIALIWDLDPSGLGGGSFGASAEEINIESWRPHRRLAGHESDIVDLAWSCDAEDSYIATVGLDSRVIVWSGPREGVGGFERIKVINGHQGFVKGVVWDPIGAYLATASDDKSVKFWKVGGDWSLYKTITKPFEGSPTSTFFMRPSWSPDGAHILCANAMSGPVFVASVISRKDWSSDIFLVGHENTVVVAAFSPRLFRDRCDPTSFATIIALGSVDQSVSVWITGQSRPVLVARDVFQRQVMDLSWSNDGLTLYACSADGHIAAFAFTTDDLMDLHSDLELRKAKEIFRFTEQQKLFKASTLQLPLSQSHLGLATGTIERPTMLIPRKAGVPLANRPKPGVPPPANGRVQRLEQQITITDQGKRRIKPTLLHENGSSDSDFELVSFNQSIVPAPASSQRQNNQDINTDAASSRGIKRTASLSFSNGNEINGSLSSKKIKDIGRVLGGDLQRSTAGPVVPLGQQQFALGAGTANVRLNLLATSKLLSVYKKENTHGKLEARNYDTLRPSEIYFFEPSSSRISWMDFSPSGVLCASICEAFIAVAFDDGSLATYSSKGRQTSSMQLDLPIHRIESHYHFLLAITIDGLVHRWNVRTNQRQESPISIVGVLSQEEKSQQDSIVQIWIHSNGLPVVITRSEKAFTLDIKKQSWVLVASGWYADCSPIWEGRTRGRGASTDSISGGNISQVRKEPIRAIESEINDLVVIQRATSGVKEAIKPPAEMMEEFTAAISLKHLQMRLSGAALLESNEEYKIFLRAYAKTLSDEGIRNQAEDLCRSLLGPIYYTSKSQDQWESSICGMEKRSLLSEVLKIMGKGRLLLGLVQTYQELLRNVSTPWEN